MTSVVGLIQKTTLDLSSSQWTLPPCVWGAIKVINQIHFCWRWYRAVEVYSNPNNLLHLIGGHALQRALGENILIRVAAQVVMICNRIILCVDAHNALAKDCKHLADLCWRRPLKRYLLRGPLPRYAWVSPSTVIWMRYHIAPLHVRTAAIMRSTWNVIMGLFVLSMRMMDAADAFAFSASTSAEGVHELFVNTAGCINTLVTNKNELLISLEKQRGLIEVLLKPTCIKFDQLHQAVKSGIRAAEMAQKASQNTSLLSRSLLIAGRDAVCATKNSFQDLITEQLSEVV